MNKFNNFPIVNPTLFYEKMRLFVLYLKKWILNDRGIEKNFKTLIGNLVGLLKSSRRDKKS